MNSNSNSSSKNGESLFPCKLWSKNLNDNDDTILYDLCKTCKQCNHLNCIDYKYLQGCNKSYVSCLINALFPVGNLNNQNFLAFIADNTVSEKKWTTLCIWNHPEIAHFFNQFNNAILENHSNPQNVTKVNIMTYIY